LREYAGSNRLVVISGAEMRVFMQVSGGNGVNGSVFPCCRFPFIDGVDGVGMWILLFVHENCSFSIDY
jgi:hypothetical protein